VRGRGRGRGRGRPPKKKEKGGADAAEADERWEQELLFAQYEKQQEEEAAKSIKKGPGRLPKSISGNTPAQSHEIDILIDKVWERDHDDLFKQPVTDEEAPGYSTMITEPMDLSTIREKNHRGEYPTWESVAKDIYLMFRNALRYNNKGDDIWALAKTQQMHARSLIENALQGKILVNAKAAAANAARKETLAAKAHARAKKDADRAKARAEQRAAQEAKILRRAGIEGSLDDGHNRSTYRATTAGTYQGQWGGLGGGKSADGAPIGLSAQMFSLNSAEDPTVLLYSNSLERFVSSLSAKARDMVASSMMNMFPKFYQFPGFSSQEKLFGPPPNTN